MSFLPIYVVIVSITYGVILFLHKDEDDNISFDTILFYTLFYAIVSTIAYFLLRLIIHIHIIDFLLKYPFIAVSIAIVFISIIATVFKKEVMQFFKAIFKLK